jgi:hypothetical protein
MPGTPGCRDISPFSADDAEVKGGGPVTIGRGCGGGADAPVILAGRPWRSVAFGGSVPGGIRGVEDCLAYCWDEGHYGWDCGRVGLKMGALSRSDRWAWSESVEMKVESRPTESSRSRALSGSSGEGCPERDAWSSSWSDSGKTSEPRF